MADEYNEMKPVGEIEGYQVFMQDTLDGTVKTEPTSTEYVTAGHVPLQTEALVEENQRIKKILHGVDNQPPAPVQGVTVKAEPADNGYEITKQPVTEEIMLPSVVEGVHTIVRNLEKKTPDDSDLENVIHENNEVLTRHDATALNPQILTQNRQLIHRNVNIAEPSGSTEVSNLKNVEMSEKEFIEANVRPGVKPDFDSEVICAVTDKVLVMSKTKMVVSVDKIMYWCNFCSYNSTEKEKMLQHIMIHRFKCQKCAFQAFSRARVTQHTVDEHCGLKRSSLKFCALLPDIKQNKETEKRKQSGNVDSEPIAKRKCLEEDDTTSDIQDEAASNDANTDRKPKTTDVTSEPEVPNESVSSVSNSSMESAKPTANTKNTSESSPSAMECSTTAVKSSKTSKTPTSKSKITVSSALCWSCGYCSFVTLNQSFLKSHLNAKHAKHPHKYVAILVSSDEEMDKIKASDAQISKKPVDHFAKKSTSVNTRVPPTSDSHKTKSAVDVSKTDKSSYPVLEIDVAESDENKSEADKAELEKNVPVCYKCAHCNFSSTITSSVKTHLIKNHVGCVLYGLDMKAVRLKEKRYIFYCLRVTCKFQTKESDEYLEHVATCMSEAREFSSDINKSLRLTKTFIGKASRNLIGLSVQTNKGEYYNCAHCSFKANNIWLKKHVLAIHADQKRVCSKINPKLGTAEVVYFCEYCFWETDDTRKLKLHIAEKHSTTDVDKTPSNKKSSEIKPQAAEAKPKPASPLKEKGDYSNDSLQPSSNLAVSINSKHVGKTNAEAKPSSSLKEKDDYTHDNQQHSGDFAESYYSKHVVKKQHEAAFSRYLNDHGTKTRLTRNAASKCLKNMKNSLPPLYACTYCSSVEYGPKLMSWHLNVKHTNEILRATNILLGLTNPSMKDAFFCPQWKCYYLSASPVSLLKHAEEFHNMKVTDAYFQRFQVEFSNDKATNADVETSSKSESPPSNKTYQCLYCPEPVFDKIADIKTHLVKLHSSDVFTYRDCFAHKQGLPSTLYMCHFLTCDFIAKTQNNYLLHMLGHQKARIYECSVCQWFSSEKGEIIGHQSSAHGGKRITVLDIDLDINEHGNIVRRVGGTVIKKEI